jgi:hypothetical protein
MLLMLCVCETQRSPCSQIWQKGRVLISVHFKTHSNVADLSICDYVFMGTGGITVYFEKEGLQNLVALPFW